jgi:exosortase/archaeosortase family protein
LYNYLISAEMHNWVIFRLLDLSQWELNWFYPDVVIRKFNLYINGHGCVHVGIPCNGIDVMGVFACIVLAFRAKWYHKLWVIVVGVFTVFILNSIRASALAAIILHNRHAFDINHKYVFNFILYGTLLLLFSLWSSKFGAKIDKQPEK